MTAAVGSGSPGLRAIAGRPGGEAMVPARYRVVDRRDESPDTVTLTIEPIDEAIATPAPGQFSMLWAFGIGEAPISLSGIDGERLVHTVRAVGPVTRALAGAEVGDVIGSRGPFGRGWRQPDELGRPVVVVAGGLGLAPLRPLVEALVAAGRPRSIRVLVGARRPGELLFRDDLERWGAEDGVTVELVVDVADRGWRGRVGLVTDALGGPPLARADAEAFVCGPEVMMRFTAGRLLDLGVAAANVQVSVERNMQCGVGWCGHCQLGPSFVCLDGPVYDWATAEPLLTVPGR